MCEVTAQISADDPIIMVMAGIHTWCCQFWVWLGYISQTASMSAPESPREPIRRVAVAMIKRDGSPAVKTFSQGSQAGQSSQGLGLAAGIRYLVRRVSLRIHWSAIHQALRYKSHKFRHACQI